MKEHPILFSTEMVKAILEGRKTQTRRVLKPQPDRGGWWKVCTTIFDHNISEFCPNGQVGDRLWVRETWADMVCLASTEKGKGKGESNPIYKATADSTELKILQGHWKPSIFMPRGASRITLEITDIRVQRLQEISLEDCVNEGYPLGMPKWNETPNEKQIEISKVMRFAWYEGIWNSINGKKYLWESNPYIWAITFKASKE